MIALEPLIITAGALVIAGISAGLTAAHYRARLLRIERMTWRNANLYYTRKQDSRATRL